IQLIRSSALSFCSAIRTNDVARLSLQSSRFDHSLIWAMKSLKSAMRDLQHAVTTKQAGTLSQAPDEQENQDRDYARDDDLDDVPVRRRSDASKEVPKRSTKQR